MESKAIRNAKAKASDTDYVRKYGPDETYWTHFLSWQEANAADYQAAIDLIESTAPEAVDHLAHLRTMRDIDLENEN